MERYLDEFEQKFIHENEFLSEINEMKENQQVVETVLGDIGIMEAEKLPTDDMVLDTMAHSGLAITHGSSRLQMRGYSKEQMLWLTGTNCDVNRDMTPAKFADYFNNTAKGLMPAKKRVNLFVEDGKVTGFLGGLTYREMPSDEVFSEVKSFVDDYFENASFVEGYVSHGIKYCRYDLSAHAADFGAVLEGTSLKPELVVQTSDCGMCSVTFRPYLNIGKAHAPVEPLRIKHVGKKAQDPDEEKRIRLDEINEALNQCYALINKGVAELEALQGIVIRHPHTTLLRVMKACKLNHRAALTVSELYRPGWGATATAFDLYMAICETQAYIEGKLTPEQKFRAADDCARAVAINWGRYDLPGDFTW